MKKDYRKKTSWIFVKRRAVGSSRTRGGGGYGQSFLSVLNFW